MGKRLMAFLLVLCLGTAALAAPALAVVEQSEEFYVNDDAGVLSPETEQTICAYNAQLEALCSGAQMVFVMVNYSDGLYADEYATQLFNDWGVGSATENNGILVLGIVRENKGWMVQGSGLKSALSDDMVDTMLNDYFWPGFDEGDYDSAVLSLANALMEWYAAYYGVTLTESAGSGARAPVPGQPAERSSFFEVFMIVVFFIILVAVLIVVFAALGGRRRYYGNYRAGAVFPFFFGRRRHWGPHINPPPPPHRGPGSGGSRPRSSGGRRPGGFGGSGFGGGGRGGGFGGRMGRGGGGRSGGR